MQRGLRSMIVKKFYGTNTRDALRQVRDALGPDALILANRQIAGGGVEIMAVSDADVATLTNTGTGKTATRAEAPAAARTNAASTAPAGRSSHLQRTYALPETEAEEDDVAGEAFVAAISNPANTVSTARNEARPFVPPRVDTPGVNTKPQTSASAVPKKAERYVIDDMEETPAPRSKTAAEPVEAAAGEAMRDIVKELKFLRQMMEGQLAGFAWSDLQKHSPEKLEIFRRLLAFGYSPALTRQLLEHMPNNFDVETGMKWIRSALHRNLPVIPAGQDLIERGGVVALVGPTGVGKTTTVAKIAARCTLKHGASKVALITTDSYRIGAHDQLRIYGKILGVPVYSVKDEEDLQLTLSDLGNRFLILIDTVGMSQRDKRLAEQIALLAGNGREVERVLLISATAQGTTLDDVVRCYQQGGGLSGGILTKLDEAMSLGTSLDVIIRHKLPLHYVTNGQRVPEDLHHPNPLYLLDRSFKNEPDASPYTIRAEEEPLFFDANSDQARISKAGGING